MHPQIPRGPGIPHNPADGPMSPQAMWLTNYPVVVRYMQRHTKSRHEAEDFAQIAFVRALEHLDELHGHSAEHIRAWLMRTAYNAFIDSIRKQRRQTPLEDAQLPAYEEDFGGLHVQELLDTLPPNLRAVVRLRHLEGYDSTQIGALLDLPPATVRTRLRAAMVLLRKRTG